MKYFWRQKYACDRFDLEDSSYRLIAWITRNRIDEYSFADYDTCYIARDCLGYVTDYMVKSNPKAQYVWRMWWAERDEKGCYKSESSSDEVHYPSMKEVKEAVQRRFLKEDDEVKTIEWEGNTTQY